MPPTPALDADEALAELTRRYFVSHGPATVKDFRWWSSLTLTQIRRGLAMVGDDLTSVDVDGLTYWFAPAHAPTRDPSPTVHVLQGYDEYGVAYTEGRTAANIADLSIAPANTNQVIQPLVLDSQVIGWWRGWSSGTRSSPNRTWRCRWTTLSATRCGCRSSGSRAFAGTPSGWN